MNKIISATVVALTLLCFSGFRGAEKAPETIAIPKEKKALLNKIVGRWITQTNIHARNGHGVLTKGADL